ncbi:FecR family protein [Sphingobacterium corticibacterium]|nr:FecR domain-containing protein [Sphingobacterium corticibacterium]
MAKHQDRIQYLLAKYKSGLLNKSEHMELAAYLKSEEGKEILFEDMKQSFSDSLSTMSSMPESTSARMRDRLIKETSPMVTVKPIIQRVWLSGLVATILLLIVGWWSIHMLTQDPDLEWQTMRTTLGEQKKIELSDGSVIFINGGATVQIPKNMTSLDYRIIKLSGEAFFDVAPDSSRPFFVVTRDFSIRVLGTSFNVDTELEQSVTVREGKVQVMQIDENSVSKSLHNLPEVWRHFAQSNTEQQVHSPKRPEMEIEQLTPPTVALGPFEKAGIGEHTGLSKTNVSNINNWMHKDLAFYDQPLELVVQQLERFYGKEITIDPALSGCKITLAANKKTLDEALNGLVRLIRDGQIKTIENGLLISGSKCQ